MTILSKSEEDTAFVFERFTIPANDWVGILADQNGRNFIRAIKHGRVAFQRQEITLEKILREYFGCQKPVLKRPVWDEDGNLRFLTIRGVKAYSALVSMLYALDTFFGPCTIAELQKEINSGKPELFGMNMASEKIDEIFNAVYSLFSVKQKQLLQSRSVRMISSKRSTISLRDALMG